MRAIRKDGLYRSMVYGTVRGPHITVGGRRLLNWSSNDYLGMTSAVVKPGQMQSSSRLLSGNDPSYKALEESLSRHKSQQSALVYPTGYMANLGAISAMVQKGDTVFSDALNHASIIDACRLAGAKISIYGHNDVDGLARMLRRSKGRKFIVTEGIFSMDGDHAELRGIVEAARAGDAAVILDDAHGDFTVGSDGRGSASRLGVTRGIDLYVSSLSKGLGSFGGYVASTDDVIELCINSSRPFIYTSALPSVLVRHATARVRRDRTPRQRRLAANVRRMHLGLRSLGYRISSKTHIIPITVGGESSAVEFAARLQDEGLFVRAVRYPTVARGEARVRLSVTAWLTPSQIDHTLDVLGKVGRRLRLV